VDRRHLYLDMAFSSLFAFATGSLGYSKAAAFRRTTAARLLARFPVVADYLADGRLNLTTLVELRDVLREERVDEILGRAAGRTEDEVKELVAALAPRPAPPDLLRRLPSPRTQPIAPVSSGPEQPEQGPTVPPAPRPRPPARMEPISEELRVLRVTVGVDFARDLEAVRAALSHQIPDGNLVAVLHECLRVTLAATNKRRRGAGRVRAAKDPAPQRSTSRYVPTAVRDAVWQRDEARCAFVSADGRRCAATHRLELHHIVPFARGGAATVEGMALRCKAHNLHQARRDFGDEHVERAIARARGNSMGQAPP
jgi:5-methylcytosine-specific restriction endonuclease McrA